MSEPSQMAAGFDYAIEAHSVERVFGRVRALDGLSFRVRRGSVTGIVGPNGAGKTTLLDIVCGLLKPTAGTVKVLGENAVSAGSSLRARIGVLPQETALYDEVSARQNLEFSAALYSVPRPARRIAEILELVGLAGRANDVVRTFSGGMQRRLAIARALLHDPPLLILDEPTVGVDLEARHQIWAHVRSLSAAGRTVLLSTNYLDEAEALCDRVAILRSGRLLAEDTPAGLLRRTGRCLELECSAEASARLRGRLSAHPGVMRVEVADFGIRAYLAVDLNPEDALHDLRGVCSFDGFRTRPPDLAEVFRALTAPAADNEREELASAAGSLGSNAR